MVIQIPQVFGRVSSTKSSDSSRLAASGILSIRLMGRYFLAAGSVLIVMISLALILCTTLEWMSSGFWPRRKGVLSTCAEWGRSISDLIVLRCLFFYQCSNVLGNSCRARHPIPANDSCATAVASGGGQLAGDLLLLIYFPSSL